MSTAQVSTTVRYVAPGGATHSSSFSASPSYTASSTGVVDIPDATGDAEEFEIPFGSIDVAAVLFVKNTSLVDLAVRFNGAVANEFRIAPGGFINITQPVAASGLPVESCSVVTIGIMGDAGSAEYIVLGS